MNVWACYFIALIPLIAAGVLWYKFNKIVWWEAVIIPIIGLVTALLFNFIAVKGMTSDTETWSGQVSEAVYVPSWTEYYEEAIYKTESYTVTRRDSEGRTYTTTETRRVFSHWEPRTRFHSSYWRCYDTLNNTHRISQEKYTEIVGKFGATSTRPGDRRTSEHNSRMISGDPMDYPTVNKNNFVEPTTDTRSWENKVKACPSVFSFKKVEPNAPVFEYPLNSDTFSSGRLVGHTGKLSLLKWDQLNSFLGPIKKVNLIAVGFGPDSDISMADLQEAKWVGGKKNDLVICFGGGTLNKPSWSKVFGWTESDYVKSSIESLILKHGISDEILNPLKDEIIKNYEIKDWSKFDYLTVEIPFYLWAIMLFVVLLTTGGFTSFAWFNDTEKRSSRPSYQTYRRNRRFRVF